jgi:hypothetical protein
MLGWAVVDANLTYIVAVWAVTLSCPNELVSLSIVFVVMVVLESGYQHAMG